MFRIKNVSPDDICLPMEIVYKEVIRLQVTRINIQAIRFDLGNAFTLIIYVECFARLIQAPKTARTLNNPFPSPNTHFLAGQSQRHNYSVW